jgi:lipopolysaccharide exporter
MVVAQLLTQVTRFVTNIVLARLLTPHAFGLVAIALVVGLFLDQLKDVGTGSALIRENDVTHALINAVFWLNVVLGLLLSLCVYFTAGSLARFLGNAEAAPVLQAFAVVTFITSLGQVHHALLRRDLKFPQIALLSTTSAVVLATVSISLALAGLGVWALVIGNIAASIVETGLSWWFDPWRPTLQVAWTKLRSIANYSLHLFLVNLLTFFFLQSDKLLVGRVLGATELGIYAMAQRILMYPSSAVSDVVNEVAFPVLAKSQEHDHELRSGFVRATSLVALVTFPLMLGATVLARPAVHVVLGPSWHSLVPLIWVLGPVGGLQTVTFTAKNLFMAKGRSDLLFRTTLFSSCVVVGSYLIGVRHGLLGLCIAYALAIALVTPVQLWFAFHQVDLRARTFVLALLPQAVMSLVMAAAVLAVSLAASDAVGDLAALVLGVATGLAVYGLQLVIFRPPALNDALYVVRNRRSASTG